jgi:protein-S-isoprenylcysteine O-methyltransferase Ste14
LIGLLLAFSPIAKISAWAIVMILLAIILAIWAILSMMKGKFRVSPIPAEKAILIISGPYKWIRHPMYSAIFLGVIGLFTFHLSWIKLGLFLALIIVLSIKLKWEEKLLNKKFDDYQAYKKHTKRIIPFLI